MKIDLQKLPPEISIRDLCRRAGLSEGTIYSHVSRGTSPTSDQAAALLTALRELIGEIEALISESGGGEGE